MYWRRSLPIILGLLLAMFIIGGMIAFASGTNSNEPKPSTRNRLERTPILSPPGVPAITPRTNGTPAVTLKDVKQYVQSHPFLGGPTVLESCQV